MSQHTSFDQALINARKHLPNLASSSELSAQAKRLSEELLYYANLLSSDATTALDLGADAKQTLLEIAIEVGEVATDLLPDKPAQLSLLKQLGYYDE